MIRRSGPNGPVGIVLPERSASSRDSGTRAFEPPTSSADPHCNVRCQLQNAALLALERLRMVNRKLLQRRHLAVEPRFGIGGCLYMGLPQFEAPRLLDMLKAQKAGGDFPTLQESTNEQQKGFYTH
jgi:hypothetical protein